MLAAALCACGGGGTGSQPDQGPSAPPPTCSPSAVTVALIGDSTQWGFDGFTKQRADPGALLQADMDTRFGAGAVVATNYGVGGTVASQAPHVSADIVVENYGINDEDFGVPIEQYRADVAAIGATIVETQIPTLRMPIEDEAAYVAAVVQDAPAVADVFGYVLGLPEWESMISPDQTHPGAALYALVVRDVLAPAVAAQVAQRRAGQCS